MLVKLKIIAVESATGVSAKGNKYDYIDITYKEGDKTQSKKIFTNDPLAKKVQYLKNGDIIDVDKAKEGEFWNWKSFSMGVEAPPSVEDKAQASSVGVVQAPTKSTYVPDDQKQVLIVRQNCVGNAVKFMESATDTTYHAVLTVAKVFEDYVFGRYTPPKDKKEGFADLEDLKEFPNEASGIDDSDIPF